MKTFAISLLLVLLPTMAIAGAQPAAHDVANQELTETVACQPQLDAAWTTTADKLGPMSWLADLFHEPHGPTAGAVIADIWPDPADPADSCDRIDCLESCATEQINCANACPQGDAVCGQECLQNFRSCREDCRNCVGFDGFP